MNIWGNSELRADGIFERDVYKRQEEQKQLIDLSRTFTKNLTELINQETKD